MTETQPARTYAERLWPSIPFFVALLLIVPSFTVLLTPFSVTAGIISGISVYLGVSAVFLVFSRKISVEGGRLNAGRATIAIEHLGDIEVLDPNELKLAIGRRLDARAYLAISGWIRRGVRIAITDPSDPAPYWVVSSRHPEQLRDAIVAAQRAPR